MASARSLRISLALIALGLAGLALAQNPSQGSGLPPLIDREILFGDPDISGPQLSPDGAFLAFIRPYKGTRNVWVKRVDEPFDKARPLTAETRPIAGYFWSRDGKYILYARDQAGDENFNVYAVGPTDAPAAGAEVPASRNLTNLPNVRAQIIAIPRSRPDIIYVGLNDRDPAWHDLYRVRISTGEKQLIRENTERFTGHVFDTRDELRLVTRSADNGDTEILRVDPKGFTKIYSCTVLESCAPVRFHPDGKRVYIRTNKGDAVDLEQLELLDVQTGKTELVERDPEKRVDLTGVVISDLTDEIYATIYLDARPRVYFRNKEFAADYEFLQSQFPDHDIRFVSVTRDERLVLISARSDREPGTFQLLDRRTRKLIPQFRLYPELVREHLARTKPIEYASADGLKIPAYLTLPNGVEAKKLPLLVFPHGGPWSRDVWGYSPLVQFFANRGFAVLQPNFRGSTGYGERFLNAGNGEWGQLMQDDITYGVKHLIEQRIADPRRVAIMGGSYGGYATLAGVAFTPDLYSAAVSFVGPSNLITLLNSIPAYWEGFRRTLYARIADPNTPAGKAQLERQSPLNSAHRIKTPLMVIQGANDPRVKKAESDQIVVALRDRKFPVEYYVADDEGHGFAKPINNIAVFAATERFLARHISGVRYQEDMKPEVAKRLAELTVDPSTVTLAKRVDAASLPAAKPVRGLPAGTHQYKVVVQAAGQQFELSSTQQIEQKDGAWTVVESVQTPQGSSRDEIELALEGLTIQRRSLAQGPVNLTYTLESGKVQGEAVVNGRKIPMSLDIGNGFLADGPGLAQVIGALPLAEGYATTLSGLNLMAQQVRLIELKVVGSERVTVPAGEFDAFKLELAAPDGFKSTLWIDKASHRAVRSVTSAPEMGGGVATAELTKP